MVHWGTGPNTNNFKTIQKGILNIKVGHVEIQQNRR